MIIKLRQENCNKLNKNTIKQRERCEDIWTVYANAL